jgi:hypothetical protein
MKKTLYILTGTLTLAFSTVLVPIAVFAQTNSSASYVLLTPLPCVGVTNGGSSGTTCTSANGSSEITSIGLQGYLVYVFKLVVALAVFLAVIMTIFGGFKYMTTEAVTGKGDARATIEHAVYGLLLALASYLILYTINPDFVNISNVAVPKLNVAVTSIAQNSGVTVDGSGQCHAAGQTPTRANIVPCPGSQLPTSSQLSQNPPPALTPTNHNTNPDGSTIVPAPGTNTCTNPPSKSRGNIIPGKSYPCYSNGVFI